MPLLPLIAAKSQKRQRHLAGKAGEPPPPPVDTHRRIGGVIKSTRDIEHIPKFQSTSQSDL